MNSNIPSPYLLYVGDVPDEIAAKTSRGLAVFRPELCIGEYRRQAGGVSLGLPRMSFEEAVARGAKTLIVGVASAGGAMRPEMIQDVVAAVGAGLNAAAGLHDRLNGISEIVAAATKSGKRLFDVRDPPAGLRVGNGEPRAGRRLLTVGTDCSVGKMYTSIELTRELVRRGIAANFRATGQTGIMIAGSGVPVDAVIGDFMSGAIEMLSPARHDGGWDVIEGQGSLFHPSFAGVSLALLHGAQPDALVLCHEPGRITMRGLERRPLPGLRQCLEANLAAARLTNPYVQAIGVALNTSKLDAIAAERSCAEISAELGLPCQDPMRTGVDRIVAGLERCAERSAR